MVCRDMINETVDEGRVAQGERAWREKRSGPGWNSKAHPQLRAA